MVFSPVKNNKSMLYSLLVSDYFDCLQCFPTNADPTGFLNSSNFSVSEQNYQVLVCIFLVRISKEYFGNKIILI